MSLSLAAQGPSLEVLIRTNTRLTLVNYTQILSEIRLSLDEVDRIALPGRTPRIHWAVRETGGMSDIRIVLVPQHIPVRRELQSLAVPSSGLVSGISTLQAEPVIPELFSARTVERIQHVGAHIERGQIKELQFSSLNGKRSSASLDSSAVAHARRAVRPSQRAWSSIVGLLEVLIAKGSRDPRAVILQEETRSAVIIRAGNEQKNLLRNAWGHRVVASGELTRNSVGQAIRLDLHDLKVLPRMQDRVSAQDLVGIIPEATGSMTTEEYMEHIRSV